VCGSADAERTRHPRPRTAGAPAISLEELAPYGEFLLQVPELRRTAAGFIGYGSVRSGDRVLVAADTQYDMEVVEQICRSLRNAGALVELLVTQAEHDREFDEIDEIRASIRRRHWADEPRRWEGIQWVEELTASRGYDLLVHGKGGPIPATPFRYEAIPWLSKEQFASDSTLMPPDLHRLINEKAWRLYWEAGRGGDLRLTDPEGTDLRYRLPEAYYDIQQWPMFNQPWWGHLMCHPSTPVLEGADAEGVVSGTTSHFSRPYPQVRVHVSGGAISRIDGGGAYGEAWRALMAETADVRYPLVPGPGLFWLVEVALGTNPKVVRPSDVRRLSSGGTEWDRNRSGVVHVGFGTMWRSSAESWAIERGVAYGHLHVHLLFPTIEVTPAQGEPVTLVDRGRLTVLDDPEVIEAAEATGGADRWLREDWIPEVPGISTSGSYDAYAANPASWVYGASAPA
jgi:hypothetical protein